MPTLRLKLKMWTTGAVYPAAASGTGNYTIAQLPVGTYELSVSVAGFKKYVRTGISCRGLRDLPHRPNA